uniref:SUI1 domain-containing protein n=1 Tax=Aplanochytrium stocchinoi TaxID=215587 RepID=A0A7S3LI75_9STRA|mmetsp:Transcript_8899/g.11590  ORF Transcript_8899/g.11590 Transcript_8899/m.11590 type:complete len:419 (+) Transcript_8899:104-1360(+)|eukprot:CAMPEP_0204841604 /NCGR_PEP_ID=MMETSP1346-20131115/42860_1 /ASSEMBLY_ACC=CAM_ASM_000771 /TAXON_ID=215587 /ORGANISM="Aplanochytrium stocchinoi, Strain GSBS06" /LENGTH=418 /DNA_ID=CAMNT_0051979881 /DNA_START=149 /DNA_END=1405 /DNA_ORIENTATION=-
MGPKNDWRDRLEAFYKHYQPEKVSGVPTLLKKIEGSQSRFDKLLSQLIQKYGPEPVSESILNVEAPTKPKEAGKTVTLNEELRDRIKFFYLHYNKDKLDTIENLVLRTKNKKHYEERLIRMLVEKYGPEPKDEDSFKGRLVRFYTKYQPSKLDSVDNLVAKAGDSETQQENLFRMLVSKYGPEPEFNSVTSGMKSLSISDSTNKENTRDGDTDDEEDEDDEHDEHDDETNHLFRKVVYCPVDGMPPEYSEYLTTFEECVPWLLQHRPDLVLTTKGGVTVQEYGAKLENKEEEGEPASSKNKSRGGAARPNKNIKSKKKGKDQDGMVTIERVSRSKRKFITVVAGLDMFDVKLKEAAKKLGKRFACSASVNKLPGGGQSIDIQGDITYDLPDILIEYFPSIEKDKIYLIEDGKKSKAFD